MAIAYNITPELRVKLKEPFGTLIRGSFDETILKLKELLEIEKPPMVVSVGDTVSHNMHEHSVKPQLMITDNRCMRKKVKPQIYATKRLHVKNPPGTITEEAIAAIKTALESGESSQIIVDGEEDLLTLIAVSYAPEGSLVVYGQPREGVVAVKVTAEKKAETAEILKAMKMARKAK
ncbi:MAG: GTP-dependent dephospho-CoA kinase family protein [Candidatus Bathyarchaeota archaeon]|nr:GTP-dependent dephospho-CoA kinase family protein [Candidatus Bathyarchaeota archaeon]